MNTLIKFGSWTIEVVPGRADTVGFAVLPRRWVVERTLAWLNRTAALPKTSRRPSLAPRRGFTSPQLLLGDWPVTDATYTSLSWKLRKEIGHFPTSYRRALGIHDRRLP